MNTFFLLDEDPSLLTRFNGEFSAAHKWGLPGAECSTCNATWSAAGHYYPGVDLSQMPERTEFEEARAEPFPEFARLRELVRPWAPVGARLPPGTTFGPLSGPASGKFGPFAWLGSSLLLVSREALEQLRDNGVRGLSGYPTTLRYRRKDPPDLVEPQFEHHGRLHATCLPPDLPPRCTTCGRLSFRWPDEPALDASSLPKDVDIFRLASFATMLIGTERFMEAVHDLELDGIRFSELPTR